MRNFTDLDQKVSELETRIEALEIEKKARPAVAPAAGPAPTSSPAPDPAASPPPLRLA